MCHDFFMLCVMTSETYVKSIVGVRSIPALEWKSLQLISSLSSSPEWLSTISSQSSHCIYDSRFKCLFSLCGFVTFCQTCLLQRYVKSWSSTSMQALDVRLLSDVFCLMSNVISNVSRSSSALGFPPGKSKTFWHEFTWLFHGRI